MVREIGDYCIEDPRKIQGRDDVTPRGLNLAAVRLRYALEALHPVQGRVLIPGCGAGRYVRALARERPDLWFVGGDLSHVAIWEARARDPGGRYVVLDACHLPFSDETFDAVIFLDVLEHVPDPGKMITECIRVLRAGGRLHAFIPLEGQSRTLYSWLRTSKKWPIHRWKRDHVGHIQQFSDFDLLRLFGQAGLEVQALSYSFHLIGQVHDILDYWRRERELGAAGILPLWVVRLLTRLAFLFTWRLAALEAYLYRRRFGAAGLHVTALKPGTGSLRLTERKDAVGSVE